MITEKIYYEDMYKKECDATIIAIEDNKIICDKTIAFPEGGGQIGDCGQFICDDNISIPFIDTKKGIGEILHLSNNHTIKINTPVYHIINSSDINKLSVGMHVKIIIDVLHRIKTSALRSALHIVLMATLTIHQNLDKHIVGCHIDTEKARIDFFCEHKFSPYDILKINSVANDLLQENIPIERYLYENKKEAWIWKCKNFECPCGGTHLQSTGQIKNIKVKRKNVGKTTERLIVTIDKILLTENMYHK